MRTRCHHRRCTTPELARCGVRECSGGVVLYGTPAEEQQGGKIEILNRHGYADIDVALMAHPSPGMMLYPGMLAREMLKVTYHGVNAHAASNPWQGVNSLDATVQGYTNVAMMRQQSGGLVHGAIIICPWAA